MSAGTDRKRPPILPKLTSGDHFFLLSYAPATSDMGGKEADKLVRRFFSDLSSVVRSIAKTSARQQVGVFELGRSAAALQRQLATCWVLVPMYSERYFASEALGKQMSAFRGRMDPAAGPGSEPVAPVLWTPLATSWPQVPAPIRPPGSSAERYSDSGLFWVMRGRANRDPQARQLYTSIIDTLGARIVELASIVRPPDPAAELEHQPNAFVQRQTLRVYVLAPTTDRLPPGREPDQYGAKSLDWNPYRRKIREGLTGLIRRVVQNLEYNLEILPCDRRDDQRPLEVTPPSPGILLIDPWALDDPEWRSWLEAFDRQGPSWIGVVVAWDPDDQQTAAARERLKLQLNTTLKRRFSSRPTALRVDAGIAEGPADLSRALSVVLNDSAGRFRRRAPIAVSPRPPHPLPGKES
jgi:FxsC-like protein